MKTNKHLEFQFHPTLNQAYLSGFYQGDIQYAREMFVIFLEDGLTTAASLDESLRHADYDAIARSVHKLRPALAMVGLTALSRQMDDLDALVKQRADLAAIERLTRLCLQGIQQQTPLLRREVERMERVLQEEIIE